MRPVMHYEHGACGHRIVYYTTGKYSCGHHSAAGTGHDTTGSLNDNDSTPHNRCIQGFNNGGTSGNYSCGHNSVTGAGHGTARSSRSDHDGAAYNRCILGIDNRGAVRGLVQQCAEEIHLPGGGVSGVRRVLHRDDECPSGFIDDATGHHRCGRGADDHSRAGIF